ncbi:hypothetical protein [Rhizosaccharibacter radicis]|uniref:Uncharacterized protein n=1 Tax=Rhizosaccharibacter radicis TaxID=2782605 RepID=A0ABT1VYV6_9PROT|nr:hypothetical protein [Acetobacteraceae bacterium KSS12]
MLIAFLVLLSIVVWSAIIIYYKRREIRAYLDNRFGPDRRDPSEMIEKQPDKLFYEIDMQKVIEEEQKRIARSISK